MAAKLDRKRFFMTVHGMGNAKYEQDGTLYLSNGDPVESFSPDKRARVIKADETDGEQSIPKFKV